MADEASLAPYEWGPAEVLAHLRRCGVREGTVRTFAVIMQQRTQRRDYFYAGFFRGELLRLL
eukprot:4293132-Pyramimonas_sp.AAC.1